MALQARSLVRAPAFIRYSAPITRRLLGFGVPMGPNTLLITRGRVSGETRTVPLAVLEVGGRRWVVGTFGEVNWVRNLRAAPEAELRIGARHEPVRAVELSRDEATRFFRDVVGPYVARLPAPWRVLTRALVRLAAPEVLHDPALAAVRRPVFELLPHPPVLRDRRTHR